MARNPSKGMKIHPSGKALGARIEGMDLAQPVSDGGFKQVLRALGEHGVLCFPRQRLETQEFARFGRMFGELEINVANQFHEPGFPEVMVLSNMPAWPVSTTTIASSGTWRVSSAQMRSGLIGTASEASAC